MLVLVALIPLMMGIAKVQARLRKAHMEVTDERVRVCSEVRVCAWNKDGMRARRA